MRMDRTTALTRTTTTFSAHRKTTPRGGQYYIKTLRHPYGCLFFMEPPSTCSFSRSQALFYSSTPQFCFAKVDRFSRCINLKKTWYPLGTMPDFEPPSTCSFSRSQALFYSSTPQFCFAKSAPVQSMHQLKKGMVPIGYHAGL